MFGLVSVRCCSPCIRVTGELSAYVTLNRLSDTSGSEKVYSKRYQLHCSLKETWMSIAVMGTSLRNTLSYKHGFCHLVRNIGEYLLSWPA